MKVVVKVKTKVEVKTLKVKAGVRYWEDATVDGIEDEKGDLIPCRDGDYWCPEIDIDKGKITNWKQGVKADVHYKVCDDGSYYLQDSDGKTILSIENNYVPEIMCPSDKGYGDYIIMNIDENGVIANWNPSIKGFKKHKE